MVSPLQGTGNAAKRERKSMLQLGWLLGAIRSIHEEIRSAVVTACEKSPPEEMARVVEDGDGDTIFSVDHISEEILIDLFERTVASQTPIVLIAEGLSGGKVILPRGTPEADARWRIIADPIDGTRCLMYQKRSAWILTGVAENRGELTTLADIKLAVQTEIPLVKQHLSDVLWAFEDAGTQGERFNRITGERRPLYVHPSTARSLEHKFCSVSRFFSGGRDVLAAIDDDISFGALGSGREGKANCFEDQYLSTGGQLYELIIGHDCFQADLRPLLRAILEERGWNAGLCCHPYDLCTELIAREAGVLISDEFGNPLAAHLNLTADVTWIGYANGHIHNLVEPLLRSALQSRGLLLI
jgi:fructose-1,6-bisphosphatase/inositol monophosphatase family enzyme